MSIVDLSIKVAAEAANAALMAHGIPGGGAVTEALLKQLLLVQDEQAAALGRIEKNVQRLIDGPWGTARLYIREVTVQGLSSKEAYKKLELAAEQLRIAVPLQEEKTFGRAYVCVDLAIVLTMLRDNAAVLYAQQAMAAATDFLLDIKSERRKPPGLNQVVRKAALREILYPKSPKNPRDYLVRIIPGSFDTTDYDKHFNTWLTSIYHEFDNIERASVALCGEHDMQVSHYQRLAPRNMRCSHGILNTKTGFFAGFTRMLAITDEELHSASDSVSTRFIDGFVALVLRSYAAAQTMQQSHAAVPPPRYPLRRSHHGSVPDTPHLQTRTAVIRRIIAHITRGSSVPLESCRSPASSSSGGSTDPTLRRRSGRSGRLEAPLATGDRTTLSLISSLIHVRAPTSITIYYRALSRLNRPAWPSLDGHPSS